MPQRQVFLTGSGTRIDILELRLCYKRKNLSLLFLGLTIKNSMQKDYDELTIIFFHGKDHLNLRI
jgi:hypothetical protein